MLPIRTYLTILLAFCIISFALILVEHPSVAFLKKIGNSFGIVDSKYVIRGLSDIRSDDHVLGNIDSRIALIEYSDFTCLLCAAMRPVFERLVAEKDLLVVYRHSYLNNDNDALARAVSAECVYRDLGDDAFFEYSNFLYSDQFKVTKELLAQKAISLGVDVQRYNRCLTQKNVLDRVDRDTKESSTLGARGTPFIVVVRDGIPLGISYANNYDEFLKRVTVILSRG